MFVRIRYPFAGVVPLVGTWIETTVGSDRVRPGLVVPLVGTWIETKKGLNFDLEDDVVPLVGTWIETECTAKSITTGSGRSPRGNVD